MYVLKIKAASWPARLACALALTSVLASCGVVENMANHCSGDLESACHFVFGGERDSEQDDKLNSLSSRIQALQSKDAYLSASLVGLEVGYVRGDSSLLELIEQLESEQVAGRAELVTLQTGYTIVSVIDPCGPSGGVADEVLLRSGNGALIASFGTGNSVRFSILEPGSYVTTDGTSCSFTVDSLGAVTPSTER